MSASSCCQRMIAVKDLSGKRQPLQRVRAILYGAADILAGAALGALLAWAHSYLVPDDASRLVAMLLSLSIVMLLQMVLSFALGAIIGSMEAMLPGTVIGMFVMVFPFVPMRNPLAETLIGAVAGGLISLIFTLWDVFKKGRLQKPSTNSGPLPVPTPPHHTIQRGPRVYDLLEYAGSRRRAPLQRQLFSGMGNRVLFAAAGTGLNFANFPSSRHITAIDLDEGMVRVARRRAREYDGDLRVLVANLHQLPFADASFDTVATASTFCSVPDPMQALRELLRVLTPGGKLLMFEHVRSRNWLLGVELDALNWIMRFLGPEMNRNTVALVQNAGFELDGVRCGYLDVFLSIEAHKPSSPAAEAVSGLIPSSAEQKAGTEEHAPA